MTLLFESTILFFAWLAPLGEAGTAEAIDATQVILPAATPKLPRPRFVAPTIVGNDKSIQDEPVRPVIADPAVAESMSPESFRRALESAWNAREWRRMTSPQSFIYDRHARRDECWAPGVSVRLLLPAPTISPPRTIEVLHEVLRRSTELQLRAK